MKNSQSPHFFRLARLVGTSVVSLWPLLWAGCSEGGASHCVPGMSVPCACTDGRGGSQTCGAGGTYDACRCTGTTGDMGPADMPGTGGPKRVFVTSVKYKANALATVCQSVADSQSLGGTWKPWLSGLGLGPSGQVSAISRIQSSGPWMLLTGEVVFKNRGQLATLPDLAIRVTEKKTLVGVNEYAWTGTALGGASSNKNCQDWSATTNGFSATYGNPDSIQGWTDDGSQTCDGSWHVYCFED